jgi:hypothetical protein
MVDFNSLDLDKIFRVVGGVFYKICQFPFLIWNKIPVPIRYGFILLLAALSLIILIYAWKHRYEWMHLKY